MNFGRKNSQDKSRLALFEQVVRPHMGAAYNLARWLCRNDSDAEDIVQEAGLRAFRAIDSYRGGDGRAWLLAIVRNACYTWLHRTRVTELTIPFDERLHDIAADAPGPEALVLTRIEIESISKAIEALPFEYREVIVLREMEDLSYKEIAEIIEAPIGTIMSRLARARRRLQHHLAEPMGKELKREL